MISLTPLIDVVFILLLFFLLASRFDNLHTITLDTPADAIGPASVEGALLVEVRHDGVRFAGIYVSLPELTQRVHQHLQRTPQRRILVQPGPGVSLQETVAVLDRLAAAGARHLSFLGHPGGAS